MSNWTRHAVGLPELGWGAKAQMQENKVGLPGTGD